MAKGLMWEKLYIITFAIVGLGFIYMGIDFIVKGNWLFGLGTLLVGLFSAKGFWESIIGKDEL